MVLVDDVLLFPVHSLLWIVREIHNAAQEELVTEAESISAELSNLYMRLETGRISEQEFTQEETVLLERLDRSQKRATGGEADQDEGEEQDQSVERRIA